MKNFFIGSIWGSILGSVSLSALGAQAQINPDQIRADLARYSGRTGTLTPTEDGEPMVAPPTDLSCKAYAKIFADYQNLALQPTLDDTPFRFMDEDNTHNLSQREVTGDVVTYTNTFDKGGTTIGCGAAGHISHGVRDRKNTLTLSANSVELRVDYRCGLFSPRRGRHQVKWSCDFNPAERAIASPAASQNAMLLKTIPLPYMTLDGEDLYVRFTPDNQGLLTIKDESTAKIVDLKTGDTIREFALNPRERIAALAMTPGGDRVIATSMNFGVFLFDVATGNQLAMRRQSDCQFCWRTSISFNREGTKVLTSGKARSPLDVMNVADLSPVTSVSEDSNYDLFSSNLNPSGNEFVTPHVTTIKVWSVATGKVERTFDSDSVAHSVFNPLGTEILIGSYKQTAAVVNAQTGVARLSLRGHAHAVSALAYSGDVNWIATGSADGTVRVWNSTTGALTAFAANQSGRNAGREVKHVELSANGSTLLAVVSAPEEGGGKIQIWSLDLTNPVNPPSTPVSPAK
ncbi:MAG: WD40 repeat domain-containing protein [Oligoflexia bacterium]